MSTWMGIRLQRRALPDNLVPERAGYGNGQAISRRVDELSDLCDRVGLTRLDHFIVDHYALVEQAMNAAGWVEPRSREVEVTGEDPAGADYFTTRFSKGPDGHLEARRFAVYSRTDPEYLAAQALARRIEDEVERGKPWFDPADGLRTVRGLMDLIGRGVPLSWLEEARTRRVQQMLDAGVDRELVEEWGPRPVSNNFGGSVCDLRTFDLELRFAIREADRFHFDVSY